MLYAILAYHAEQTVTSWTPEEDAALMTVSRRCTSGCSARDASGRRRGLAPPTELAC